MQLTWRYEFRQFWIRIIH